MKMIYAIGLILMLFLSACAAPQQPAPVTTPDAQEEEEAEEAPVEETEEEEEVAKEVEVAAAAGGDVVITANGFDPEELKIVAGSSVAWVNNEDSVVTLNFYRNNRVFNAEVVKAGETIEVTFDEEGTFAYQALELGTEGTIVVE